MSDAVLLPVPPFGLLTTITATAFLARDVMRRGLMQFVKGPLTHLTRRAATCCCAAFRGVNHRYSERSSVASSTANEAEAVQAKPDEANDFIAVTRRHCIDWLAGPSPVDFVPRREPLRTAKTGVAR